jgi:hypothetical protein
VGTSGSARFYVARRAGRVDRGVDRRMDCGVEASRES